MISMSEPLTFSDLGNDFLDIVLTYINDYPTLDNCRNVCKVWRTAVKRRMTKFEYVIGADEVDKLTFPPNTLDLKVKQCKEQSCMKRMLLSLDPKFLPNVKFLDLSTIPIYSLGVGRTLNEQMAELGPQLRGLVDSINLDHPTETFCIYTRNLTIYHGIHLVPYICEPEIGSQLKQLAINCGKLSLFLDNTSSFRNLKRLYFKATSGWVSDCKGRAELTNLKVLEFHEIQSYSIAVLYPIEQSVAMDFLDLCPNLVKATIYLPRDVDGYVVNENIKNYNLKDLIISYSSNCDQKWDSIRKALTKFPCLKRLAIRGNPYIVDENVTEIFELLPELDLLDLRNSQNLSWEVGYIVDEYCRKRKKYIEFIGKRDHVDRYDVDFFNKKTYRSLVKEVFGADHFFVPWFFSPYLFRNREFESLSAVAGARAGLRFDKEKGWVESEPKSDKKEEEKTKSLSFSK